jgi:hypothetical protein
MSRVPNVNSDVNQWGTILNDFLGVALNSDGTIGNLNQPLNFTDTGGVVRAQVYSVSGDMWFMANAYWDPTSGNFFRVDQTHYAFGLQLQGQGYIPGEPDLGYYVPGATIWVAQPTSYTLIRGAGQSNGLVFGAVGGWELGITCTAERQLTVGGGGIEIDGYGTIPYGRVVNNTTGTALARRMVGMMQNAYTDFGGYDDPTQESWYWGYMESYNPAGGGPPYPVVSGSSHWCVGYIPANTSPTSGVFNEYLSVSRTGAVTVSQDPTTALGVATKEYVDSAVSGTAGARGGEAFFTGNGTQTAFLVAHGIGHLPTRAALTPMNQASLGCWYSKDATNIGINYATAPGNGVQVAVSWTAYP